MRACAPCVSRSHVRSLRHTAPPALAPPAGPARGLRSLYGGAAQAARHRAGAEVTGQRHLRGGWGTVAALTEQCALAFEAVCARRCPLVAGDTRSRSPSALRLRSCPAATRTGREGSALRLQRQPLAAPAALQGRCACACSCAACAIAPDARCASLANALPPSQRRVHRRRPAHQHVGCHVSAPPALHACAAALACMRTALVGPVCAPCARACACTRPWRARSPPHAILQVQPH